MSLAPPPHAAPAPIVGFRAREPYPAAVSGLSIEPAAPGLWRVVRQGGVAVGRIERHEHDGRVRYRARRIGAGGAPTAELGEFWSARDAADCFR